MFEAVNGTNFEELVRLDEPRSGLSGVIAIHSTALGPAAGGCRLWQYPSDDAALADACRLAEGMSYKNALAGLPFGGAKAVLRLPEGPFDRDELFRAFGRAVRALDGRYVTAEDVGTRVRDMEVVGEETRHVAGRTARGGLAGGDPSPWTALGVFEAMTVAARHALGADLSELTVAVQGTGNVGGILCRMLADAGARLVLADMDPARRDRLAAIHGARIVDVADIAAAEADIFAPCALGGVLDAQSIAAMRAKLVCGAANNQLAGPEAAALLLERGIAYVPDYVANAGGIINVAAEYLGEGPLDAEARVMAIGPRVATILAQAAREGQPPSRVADRMAQDVIASAARLAA
ncbi:Glu/Leu/Phe/Val dehydrogenase [Sphingomonas gei]|uniref:Glu/Leu/Phe/Val dehydrogenase n=1 Tax=Sphingomonas gei TaxID=1395960 RepID=A0A4S1XAP8_9SPHN|nr:Glu/Leu/Phe/Val dehydrogenase dimerization domain-containing protein [Sphingomonas gei]TGX52547.1 Glu/Leu/Phe/Val dehydrogenase [Sphingomonas gei]